MPTALFYRRIPMKNVTIIYVDGSATSFSCKSVFIEDGFITFFDTVFAGHKFTASVSIIYALFVDGKEMTL